jgi:hypothetical protein
LIKTGFPVSEVKCQKSIRITDVLSRRKRVSKLKLKCFFAPVNDKTVVRKKEMKFARFMRAAKLKLTTRESTNHNRMWTVA